MSWPGRSRRMLSFRLRRGRPWEKLGQVLFLMHLQLRMSPYIETRPAGSGVMSRMLRVEWLNTTDVCEMLAGEVGYKRIFPRPVWVCVSYVCSSIQDRHLYLIDNIDKGTIIATNLSKIITAGVIKVAEPAATKTSAARYSASLFRL